jgi:uncharacterized protein YeaO (DUF488 family)
MSARVRAGNVKLKRAYDAPARSDGKRVLIDRLWPRGVRKADAAIALWLKELAPSTELREWFDHKPARWLMFQRRYVAEIRSHAEVLAQLRRLAMQGRLTLVYAARDEAHNDAIVLRNVLLGR